MALHRREQIIAAVVTKLTGLVTTGSNVFRERPYNFQESELPCLIINQGPETLLKELTQGLNDWQLEIIITAKAKSVADKDIVASSETGLDSKYIETTLNLISKEIAVALMADITQGLSFVIDTDEGDSIEAPDIFKGGSQPIGSLEQSYFFHYRRSKTDPSA